MGAMGFCSSCGTERPPKAHVCPSCKKDFRYLTEVNAYPYMLCLRRKLFKGLNPTVTSAVTVTEPNIPYEVFEALFGRYGKLVDAPFRSSQTNLMDMSSPGPSPRSILPGHHEALKEETGTAKVTRVIWRKIDLDAICKFQSVDVMRAVGAAVLLPEALGCAAVIPPFYVSHVTLGDGEQRMTVSYSYAFLNAASRIIQPLEHCLDLGLWGAPSAMCDAQGYIVDTVAAYPSELKLSGVAVPDLVIKSATGILNSRASTADPEQEEQSRCALEQWAARAKNSAWGPKHFSPASSVSSPQSIGSPRELLR